MEQDKKDYLEWLEKELKETQTKEKWLKEALEILNET